MFHFYTTPTQLCTDTIYHVPDFCISNELSVFRFDNWVYKQQRNHLTEKASAKSCKAGGFV